MNLNSEHLKILLSAFAGSALFWYLAGFFLRKLHFNLGRGNYVGFFPQLGAIAGAFGAAFISDDVIILIIAFIAAGFTGLLNDLKKVSNQICVPAILIIYYLFFSFLESFNGSVLIATVWCGLIFICLKLASLVYEMPFILVSTTSLASLLLLIRQSSAPVSEVACLALLACAVSFMGYSSTSKRALSGTSGLAVWGLLTGLVALSGNSENLLFPGLLIPSMVVVFPPALISIIIITSYMCNNLHGSFNRKFSWSLQREQLVVLTGLIFLCLNFLVLLVEFEAPVYGYIALGLLLIASMTGFFKTFARKNVNVNALYDKVQILDTEIDAVSFNDVLGKIEAHLINTESQGLMHIITADSLAVLRTNEDDYFSTLMKRAELVIPDGAGIIWAADFLGTPLPERVPGVALVNRASELAAQKEFKPFFLGGKPDIAEKAFEMLKKQYPCLRAAGIRHGYFAEGSAEEEEIIKQICQSNANLIFVALGVPRQERFISKLRLTGHKAVAIGVGGSFDVISETLPRAPEWMQRFAIEWLFRLWLEPFRIGRIAKIPAFVLQVFRFKWNQD